MAVLVNMAEIAVSQMLNSIIENYKRIRPELCTCERCREDIMAIALNRIPPKYVSTPKGRTITSVAYENFGGRAQVTAQVVYAIETVIESPRHNE
ncbi:late competence development ComFB family protein [Desulforudis sp. 1088]|uniref:late competence development ComFB family protein n=1 Tax=Desulforudis sp. 1088 TaxID=3416137 RepID=UPI003CFBB773